MHCQSCQRRPAIFTCPNPAVKKGAEDAASAANRYMDEGDAQSGGENKHLCRFRACEACYECIHRPACDAALSLQQAAQALEAAAKAAMRAQKDKTGALAMTLLLENLEQKCVACEEPADQKCLQCGDFYCSKTWMGNPGCFVKYHSKGKRAEHKCVSLESLKPAAGPPGGAAAWASKKAPRPTA